MEGIIAQTAYGLVEEIFKTIEKVGLSDVGRTCEEICKVVKEGSLEIVSAAISEMDNAVLAAKKERKLDGLTVKERNVPRVFTTSLGELRFKRTYFSLKDAGNIYLVDHLIGIEPNERLSKQLCAELVQYSASMSMQKAANVTGGLVSRQTVNNKLLSMKAPVTAMERVKNTPSELHVFADEDHVHLRPRKSAFVPLVTVTEGMDTSDPKRHRTINPVHFQGFGSRSMKPSADITIGASSRTNMLPQACPTASSPALPSCSRPVPSSNPSILALDFSQKLLTRSFSPKVIAIYFVLHYNILVNLYLIGATY